MIIVRGDEITTGDAVFIAYASDDRGGFTVAKLTRDGDRGVVVETQACREHGSCRALLVEPDETTALEYVHADAATRYAVEDREGKETMSTDVVDALRAHIATVWEAGGLPAAGAPSDVLAYTDSAVTIRVGAWSGGYSLWWSDHVVNEWLEWFPTLPVVMARVAALMHCIETDTLFCGSDAFQVSVTQWFREVTSRGPQRLPAVVETATTEAVPAAAPQGAATTADTIRCPTTADTIRCPTTPDQPDGSTHTITGCGPLIPAVPDEDGIIDCPQCGMWFTMEDVENEEYDLDIHSSGIGWRSSMVLALQAAVADITREGPYAPVEITWDNNQTQIATLHGFGAGDDIISFAGQLIELDRITRLRA